MLVLSSLCQILSHYQRNPQAPCQSVLQTIFPDIKSVVEQALWPLSPYLINKKYSELLCYLSAKFGLSIQNFCFLKWKKTVHSKLTVGIGPNAPDVLALPAELVCDPCQNCSCHHESTPATGLLSAKDSNCIRKWSKLPGSICLWMEPMSPCDFAPLKCRNLWSLQALTLSSGSNIWKLVAKSQTA